MIQVTNPGDVVSVQIDWWRSFALLPHKTISGQWIWLKPVYKRIVWVYTGFADEPEVQYGTIVDILKCS